MRDHFYTPFLQLMFPDLFFNKIKCKIQQHGNDAEDHNGHQDPCKSECLASVNDQVSQAFSGTDKFSDDHAYQAKPDVDLHHTQDKRNGGGQDDLQKLFLFVSPQSFDQLQLFRICLAETGVQIDNGAEDGYRHAGDHNGTFVGTKPYDQKRGQSRFRETVQYHQTWLQDPCDPSGAPEKYCGSYTQDHNKKETDKSFCQCHGNMCKQGLIPAHGKKGLCDQGRTAEDKGIDPSKIRGYFPNPIYRTK